MRGCHSVHNVHSEKHEKSLLFVSVIVPMNNPARRPTVLFLASKEPGCIPSPLGKEFVWVTSAAA